MLLLLLSKGLGVYLLLCHLRAGAWPADPWLRPGCPSQGLHSVLTLLQPPPDLAPVLSVLSPLYQSRADRVQLQPHLWSAGLTKDPQVSHSHTKMDRCPALPTLLGKCQEEARQGESPTGHLNQDRWNLNLKDQPAPRPWNLHRICSWLLPHATPCGRQDCGLSGQLSLWREVLPNSHLSLPGPLSPNS